MSHKVLITGANGFIGHKLCARLDKEIIDFDKFSGDITHFSNVQSQLESGQYSTIFHFAGVSNVGDCNNFPDKAYSVNVTGTFNLLEAIKRSGRKTKIIFPSTAHVYATPDINTHNKLIHESFSVDPKSIYAFTKLQAEKIIQYYFEHHDIGEAIVLRLFNHSHKSQKGPFFFPQLIAQINAINGNSNLIKVGNLEMSRDFSLVSDLINLLVLTTKEKLTNKFELFNVCSSRPRLLKDLAIELSQALGKVVNFEIDPEKLRPGEPAFVVGSNKKIKNSFKWSPQNYSNQEFIERFLSDD
jgi:GDP-4-dehydro-6-deoxy-D-mannose reductase